MRFRLDGVHYFAFASMVAAVGGVVLYSNLGREAEITFLEDYREENRRDRERGMACTKTGLERLFGAADNMKSPAEGLMLAGVIGQLVGSGQCIWLQTGNRVLYTTGELSLTSEGKQLNFYCIKFQRLGSCYYVSKGNAGFRRVRESS